MTALPIKRVVLYKHGVGHFEREGRVEGDAVLSLTFKQAEVSDVLKSLTVLDLDGGHVASVSYDSTKPLDQLLAEVALSIPDQGSLVGLLPQIKGARIAVQDAAERREGILLGVDTSEKETPSGLVRTVLVSLLSDAGEIRSFDLYGLSRFEVLDPALRRDLEFYLRTVLSAKKKDARTFSFFAQGQGDRGIRLSYTLGAPVWKATYRIILGEPGASATGGAPLIQGWAVVDNTQDEDWEDVELALVAGLPVSFIHDLYTPRYIRRPVVAVKETTGVLPPVVEEGMELEEEGEELDFAQYELSTRSRSLRRKAEIATLGALQTAAAPRTAVSSTPAQVRERKLGDLFEYRLEHPVTIRRNQSALVPIVLKPFEGRSVLLHNKETRPENPMRCVELKNTTGLTLEGGPVTVLEGGSYVGEAMLDTLKPDEPRLIPYAVELGVHVLDNVTSHKQPVSRVVIRNKRISTFRMQVQKTTYHLNNKSDLEQVLYLDHPRGAEWQLVQTPEPVEVTANHWRFRFPLPAKKTTAFTVRQQRTVEKTENFSDLAANQLGYWIEQKYLDAATEAALRKLIEQQQRLAQIDGRIQSLQEERDAIHVEQKRVRENLQALGDRAAEKELRERFVRTLNAQEDRLEQITAGLKEQTAERDRVRAQIDAMMAGLEYEATVS